jgi:uncharacterized membrane protein YheB (UPF0754 family)
MDWKIFLIPLTGFVIGYFTNYIAIKMLFHPRRKILWIKGVLPKRKEILARKIGEITPEIMPSYFRKIENIPVIGEKVMEGFKKSVENQINSLSLEELEGIVYKVAKKELRFVELVGGLIGLLIGIVQAAIILI